MIQREPNPDISTTAEYVDDADADARPEAAKATSGDDVHSVSVLFELFKDLEKSEEGADDAQALRYRIPMAITKDTSEGLDMELSRGRTLLHIAAREGLKEAAKRLVNVKAILNARDDYGSTPLYEACWAEHIDIVRLLLDAEADSTILDNDGWSPLYIAARYRCSNITQLLLEKRDWDLGFKEKLDGRTPLHAAARGGGGATVRYLRAKGAKLDLRDDSGWTPLMTAVMSGKEEEDAMHALLERRNAEDLQLETKDSEGATPLLRAAENNFWDGVHILVEAGAKCNTSKTSKTTDTEPTSDIASDHNTALHFAVRKNNLPMVGFLLRHHANVNARDVEGQQPLHLASIASDHESSEQSSDSDTDSQVSQETRQSYLGTRSAGYIDMVRLLLEKHAKTNAETKNGKTAMELAFDNGHYDRAEAILDAFVEARGSVSDAYIWAAGHTKRHKIAVSLAQKQTRTSEKPLVDGSKDWTAIEWMAYAREPQALWLLIASAPRSKDTTQTLEKAKAIVDEFKNQAARAVPNSENQKSGQVDDQKKRGKGDKISQEMQNIFENPPIGLICTDSPTYSLPQYERKFPSLTTYKSAIVRFYKRRGQFGSIIKTPTIEDTIYRQGPEKIMRDAVEKYQEHSRGLDARIARSVQGSIFMDPEPKFTWIHLPATNMVWMDDLVQRIMRDEDQDGSHFNQAKSFFKDSWIEVPDKASPSRIMRPRFVSCDAILRDTDYGAQTEDSGIVSKMQHDDGREIEGRKGSKGDQAEAKKLPEQKQKESQDEEATKASGVAATAIYMPYLSYSFHCVETKDKPAQPREQAGNEHETGKPERKKKPKNKEVFGPEKEPQPQEKLEESGKINYAEVLLEARKKYRKLFDEYDKEDEQNIHGSSTLDESYYHFGEDEDSTNDKIRRNESQVATDYWRKQQEKREEEKWEQDKQDKEEESYWLLIRVNQLWIWTINNKWLLSASSHPIDDVENELQNGILERLEKQGEAGGSDLQPGSAAEMSQLIVDYCIDFYERKPKARDGGRPENCTLTNFPSIRQTFSKSINSIARDETKLFSQFRDLTKKLR
ncbi:hypothetical protein CGMCC3_g3834 [Colletotrichum fructicola]|uniref:Ankyrin unc44 n=1 Tax=Colletotrichum fructicola (strain Nara gc5) TaxID=1213859 RepID=L2G131_COLFN|nr:uncharacterized protein CGMCC3_g3834 [Colletotrichum fructicola]KAE9580146.1 hypothetical protein CGMCC3_g3834 [Colletotrichum fructicola]KAF4478936.1 Ankyrin-2 [Colletotrichum fructicola Nara gc5]